MFPFKVHISFCHLLYFGMVLFGNSMQAQTNRIDSLRKLWMLEKNPKHQEKILLALCENNFSLSADSLEKYVQQGLQIADKNSEAAIRFTNFYSFYYFKIGKPAKASLYLDSLLKRTATIPLSPSTLLEIHFHKTISLIRNNEYKEAINAALRMLALAEKNKDTLAVMRSYSLLGWANMELDNETEAIHWLNKGITVSKNEALLANVNSLFLNISSCYNLTDKPDSAHYYVNKGIAYSKQVENLTSEANGLNIRAAIYSRRDLKKEALLDLETALQIRKKIGDLHYIISDMGQLAHYYAYVKQANKGIAIALQGIELAKKSNNLYKLIYIKKGLFKNQEVKKEFKQCTETLVDIIQLKDSLYEKNTEDAIAEMSTKYELKKKENIILQQKNTLLQTKYISIASGISFVLASIIIWLLYRNYKHRQEVRLQRALSEEKLLSIQAIQQAEEKERKRIAADLHDNLGSYAAAISSNIGYLKQSSDGNTNLLIKQLDENAQGMVTQLSDSIWVLKNEHLSITKLADRFKVWLQRMMQNYPQVIYYYTENIEDDLEQTPATTLHLFLILKECITNTLKHSQCSEMHIQLESNPSFQFILEDNGIGLDVNKLNAGNGIENIRYRAKQCNVQVSWDKLEPSGTRVQLISNTTN
jgi:signal transduction histidine kinase/ribosomal protein S16